tara:strand:+ start:494 stop:763 length:270 start_codon:yes stop_codon:yes gene_type:complete
MKYTQQQWEREVGWGKVPPEYAFGGEEMTNPRNDNIWYPLNATYNNIKVDVTFNMKVKNNDVQSQNSETTRTNDKDNKQEEILRNSRGE